MSNTTGKKTKNPELIEKLAQNTERGLKKKIQTLGKITAKNAEKTHQNLR